MRDARYGCVRQNGVGDVDIDVSADAVNAIGVDVKVETSAWV